MSNSERGRDWLKVTETTALGTAYLAGLGAGLIDSLDHVDNRWRPEVSFHPVMVDDQCRQLTAA